ncbi:MAG: hypothetical protein ABI977_04165 [Acidobacteriota bacterium]
MAARNEAGLVVELAFVGFKLKRQLTVVFSNAGFGCGFGRGGGCGRSVMDGCCAARQSRRDKRSEVKGEASVKLTMTRKVAKRENLDLRDIHFLRPLTNGDY